MDSFAGDILGKTPREMSEETPGSIPRETPWEILYGICKRIHQEIIKILRKYSNIGTGEFYLWSGYIFRMNVFDKSL